MHDLSLITAENSELERHHEGAMFPDVESAEKDIRKCFSTTVSRRMSMGGKQLVERTQTP